MLSITSLFSEIASVCSITISQEIFRCGVERKGFHDLLRGALCGRMSGDVKMDDPSTVMRKDDKNEQDLRFVTWINRANDRRNKEQT